jgi:hypothetical protein
VESLGALPQPLVAPDLVDEAIAGDHLARVQKQKPQQGALSAAPKRERVMPVVNLEGSEDAEVHRSSPPRRT